MKTLLSASLVVLLLISGCVNDAMDDSRERPTTLPRSLTANEETLISSGNDFSFNIFNRIVAAEEDKNVFISPLSISMALGMTLNGAEGSTKAGIKETLGMSEMELQAINQSYQSLIKLLIELDSKVEMSIGNSLWTRQGFPVQQSFKDTLATYFDARAEELDFSDPSAADVINSWVSERTNGRIEKIIDDGIPGNIVLYLINTVYFKGDWLYRFDAEDTKPADFHLADGSTVEVDMMSQEMPLATYQSEGVEMAELAYGDSLYNMTILMPRDTKTNIDSFIENTLNVSNLSDWTNQLRSGGSITLRLPKFESTYKKKLNSILIDMGMGEAFGEGQANFSNINPNVQLFISEVMHKASINVDEEGSEAAAATSVSIGETSAGANVFSVDRPFVYLIRERISGTVLFMGVMKNPNVNTD